ncbi:MAG TPA: hypothetical protein VNS32_22820 [Flavisolibacter sp.]|nr:hypothetical protein [Flavisolibacter sp.]
MKRNDENKKPAPGIFIQEGLSPNEPQTMNVDLENESPLDDRIDIDTSDEEEEQQENQ